MSKGIDYSKWDNFVDSSSDEEEEKKTSSTKNATQPRAAESWSQPYPPPPQRPVMSTDKMDHVWKNRKDDGGDTPTLTMMEETVGDIDDMIGTQTRVGQQATAMGQGSGDLDSMVGNHMTEKDRALLEKIMDKCKGGKSINRLMISDYYSATALLDMVTPEGICKRQAARAVKGDCCLYKDPVHIHLWSLALKLREGPQHTEKVLRNDVLPRILSVMEESRPQKYRGMGKEYVKIVEELNKVGGSRMDDPPRRATRNEQLVAKELCSDTFDLVLCTAVLHELCRYRSGCVHLAEHQQCLKFLIHEIPLEDTVQVSTGLTLLDYGERKKEDNDANWASLLSYNPGMIEQGTIDTLGRLLNGLDQHVQLRKKVAKKVKQEYLPKLERKVLFLEIMKPMGKVDPLLFHCIDLVGSLTKLKAMVSSILGHKTSKAWKSTFLFDRRYIDNPHKIGQVDDTIGNKRACHFCKSEPKGNIQMCSRCKTVFYCSRECQVNDWKNHKKDCIKHGGVLPSEKSAHSGHLEDMVEKLKTVVTLPPNTKE